MWRAPHEAQTRHRQSTCLLGMIELHIHPARILPAILKPSFRPISLPPPLSLQAELLREESATTVLVCPHVAEWQERLWSEQSDGLKLSEGRGQMMVFESLNGIPPHPYRRMDGPGLSRPADSLRGTGERTH